MIALPDLDFNPRGMLLWQTVEVLRSLGQSCAIALAYAYGIPTPAVESLPGVPDCYMPGSGMINLTPRLSVVSFLHEFAHHLDRCRRGRTGGGGGERFACRWSINMFRRCFPRSFARCIPDGHTLRRPATPSPKAA